MRSNEEILKNSDITKVYISYLNRGQKVKQEVRVSFADMKECYFSMATPINFEKPQKRIPVEITVYTPDGVHKGNSVLTETEVTISEVMFILNAPQTWKFVQMRLNARKLANISVKVSFNDGFEMKAPSHNISLGGISFFYKEKLSSIYTKLPCQISLKLPGLDPELYPTGEFVVTGRYVREKDNADEFHPFDTLYVFKYVGLNFVEEEVLEYCLSKLK